MLQGDRFASNPDAPLQPTERGPAHVRNACAATVLSIMCLILLGVADKFFATRHIDNTLTTPVYLVGASETRHPCL